MHKIVAALMFVVAVAMLGSVRADEEKAKSAVKTDTPLTNDSMPDDTLLIFGATDDDFDNDISPTIAPLVFAAVAEAKAENVDEEVRDIVLPGGLRQLNKRVGGAEKDDYLFHGGIIICRVWYAREGNSYRVLPSTAEKYRILRAGDKKAPLTPERVRAQVSDYLKKTATPPPGSLAAMRIEQEQRATSGAADALKKSNSR